MRLDFDGVPVLETERLIMRGYTLDDLDDFVALRADPLVMEHITGKPDSAEDAWRKFMVGAGMWSLMGLGYWALFERASGAYLGEVGFADFSRKIEPSINGRPEAGWVLRTQAHGKGYATEAMKAALGWGLSKFGGVRPVCIMDPDYAATIRVAEKCGFVELARTVYRDEPCLMMEFQRSDLLG